MLQEQGIRETKYYGTFGCHQKLKSYCCYMQPMQLYTGPTLCDRKYVTVKM